MLADAADDPTIAALSQRWRNWRATRSWLAADTNILSRETRRAAAADQRAAHCTAAALDALSKADGNRQVVLLVRHGEALHNEAWRTHRNTVDTDLTETGRQQAKALAGNPALAQCQFIAVSPMGRAIQTAAAIFGETPTRRISLCALHSERCDGAAKCNTGSPKAVLASRYPFVAAAWGGFDDLAESQWWPDERADKRDGWKRTRVPAFLAWLRAQPERVIAVVGHGAFFADERLAGRLLGNCEIAAVVL